MKTNIAALESVESKNEHQHWTIISVEVKKTELNKILSTWTRIKNKWRNERK